MTGRLSRLSVVLVFCGFLLPYACLASTMPSTFLDCVVVIGRTETASGPMQGQWVPEASGFLYGEWISKIDEQNSNYIIFLVTNRHVIEEHMAVSAGPLQVKFNLKSEHVLARSYDVFLKDPKSGNPLWYPHPNAAIDLVVIPINANFLKSEGAKFQYFRSNQDVLVRSKAKDLGLSEGDGVFVLGFPMGLVGNKQDYVIVRQGSIARVRDMIDDPSVSSFLIDAFIFPGNSGGPVVLKPDVLSIEQGKPPIESAYLIGVVRSYLPYTDIALSLQTRRPRITFEENSGLAEVLPVDYIEEAIATFKATLKGSR